jgi:uncharacterized NAD(P)/FAD-binding protein YdhS
VKTVAIIGGGFSGTVAAVNLARLAKQPLRIHIINHGSPLGRGVAYGTKQSEHLLNVAARNMSAFPDLPNHFLDWLGTRAEFADVPEAALREQFVPRKIYGDYLQSLLFWYGKEAANPRARIEFVNGEALDIMPGPDRVLIVVERHPTIEADKVLLATGNPPPADLPFASGFTHPRLMSNPWQPIDYAKADTRENIVLVGAGLTMIDVFLTLSSLNWQGTIYAVSRTGLLPLSHFHGVAYADFPPPDPTTLGLAELANLMETHCQRLRERGENPAIIVDKLRPFTQRVWQNFSVEEKTRFLREYRTRWNVTRHRVAQSIHEQLTAAIKTGRLQIVPGNIRGMAGAGERITLTVEKKGGERTALEAGWVINCTGPLESYRNGGSHLYQNLFDRGLVQADDMDMGIKVGANFGVIDGGGYGSGYLFAIGPMLKGSLWETTAVPELRNQALRVAETMLTSLEGEASPGWFAEMWVDVVEYVI